MPLLTLGSVPPEEVPYWINAANAVLVPSQDEGFGLSVIEALACGVPAFGTPVGIHPVALHGIDGAFCEEWDADRWRAALAPVARGGRPAGRRPRASGVVLRRPHGRPRGGGVARGRRGARRRPEGSDRAPPILGASSASATALPTDNERIPATHHALAPRRRRRAPSGGPGRRAGGRGHQPRDAADGVGAMRLPRSGRVRLRRPRCRRSPSRRAERSTTATPPVADPQARAGADRRAGSRRSATGSRRDAPEAAPAPVPPPREGGSRSSRSPRPAVLLADPSVPAGVDPAAAPFRPPAGRRGRLRRRLRYLRRARELMLRDLGGLLYEIHRTGGGRVDQHATIVRAKVQRIAGLDAEAHAIEGALAAPRSETVVFEPGIGGTCAVCGELMAATRGSAPTAARRSAQTQPPETGEQVATEPAKRAFWRRAARRRAAAASGDPRAGRDRRDHARARPRPTKRRTPTTSTPDARRSRTSRHATRRRRGRRAARRRRPPTPASSPRNPYSGFGNGRPEERKTPGPSAGDPLISRERP